MAVAEAVPAVAHPGTGLYLHVPFCAHRCAYCDFNTYAGMDELIPRYMAALRADLGRVAAAGPPDGGTSPWPVIDTVFIGGGTPTLVGAHELGRTLATVRDVLPLAPRAEITVEANPETVTVELAEGLAAAGVGRVSMGAQSFTDRVLATLGRRHRAERPLEAVTQLRAGGVERISLDLIYGTPGETDEDWRLSLHRALDAGVDHVSAYALTVEANTDYARQIRAGEALAPDDDVQADRMDLADRVLSAAGLARYELSNWARPGEECRHNLVYWHGGDWLGIGAGAHAHWKGWRWWSLRAPARYADTALAGADTTAGGETVDPVQRRTERLLLGLRTVAGVADDEVAPVDVAVVGRLVDAGLLQHADGRLRLTSRGFQVANAVTVALL